MKNIILVTTTLCAFFFAGTAMAMSHAKDDHSHSGHTKMEKKMDDHSKMDHGSSHSGGHFKHAAMVDGIHADFQIMSLASMKMKDPDGKTHHVMASFKKDGKMIKDTSGEVKLTSPSGKEQVGPLNHLGGGIFATNFNFDEEGKWEIVCQFANAGNNHEVDFSYEHKKM